MSGLHPHPSPLPQGRGEVKIQGRTESEKALVVDPHAASQIPSARVNSPAFLAARLRERLSNSFYGWRIVAASFVINAVHDGTYYLGTSIFLLPIGRDLGLSRTMASLPFTVNRIVPAICGPLVGALIDRYGPARVLTTSAILAGVGWILLSRANSLATFIAVATALLGIGMMSWVMSTTTVVNVWFRRRRSTAMSYAFTGFTTGGAVFPPLLALGVSRVDWRFTMLATGLMILIVVVPLATRLRRSPESMGLLPDGGPPTGPDTGTAQARTAEPEYDFTVREALGSRAFWMLTVSTGLHGIVATAFGLHFVAIMVSKGLEESTAGYLIGLLSLLMAPMVLIMGRLGDMVPMQRVAAAGHFIRIAAFAPLFLWDEVGIWRMLLVLALLSPTEATWSLGYALVADLFGRRNVATLRGFMGSSVSVWTIGTPVLAGWIYDYTGGYDWLLGPSMLITLAAALLLWFIPDPRIKLLPGRGRLGEPAPR